MSLGYTRHMTKVAVVGLGKVGLPLALAITKGEYEVVGVDISLDIVATINAGRIPGSISEPGLGILLTNGLASGQFSASTELSVSVQGAQIIVVIVPLKLDDEGNADFAILDSVTAEISKFAPKGALVIYETTLPIGTTRNRFVPILANGMGIDQDEVLATFSPERIFSGAYLETLASIPKVIGGVNQESSKLAASFYHSFIKNLDECRNKTPLIEVVSNAETAEFVKIAETTYRDVNIALANTFAMHAVEHNLDFSEIRDSCNANDFSHIHKPSIWVGGHCIPVYPRLYLSTDSKASLISTAREINESMPAYYMSKVLEFFGDVSGTSILIKGITYRGDVKEVYMSGAYVIRDILQNLGAKVFVEDPLFTHNELIDLGFTPYEEEITPEIVIFQADHDAYKSFSPESMPWVKLFVDGRSFVSSLGIQKDRVFSLGTPSDTYAPRLK